MWVIPLHKRVRFITQTYNASQVALDNDATYIYTQTHIK